jgi:hypothetical protein
MQSNGTTNERFFPSRHSNFNEHGLRTFTQTTPNNPIQKAIET